MAEEEIWAQMQKAMAEAVEWQKERVLAEGRRRVPFLTPEDVMQPNDYPELENDPEFRYEEGVLAGMQTLQMSLQALKGEVR